MKPILILGDTGSGKTTSIRNLDPKETFIINVADKDIPIKGFKNNYKEYIAATKEGNMFTSHVSKDIVNCVKFVEKEMPHIKNLILDDVQYSMAIPFIARAKDKGYEKFNELGQEYTNIILSLTSIKRPDLLAVMMSHTDYSIDYKGVKNLKAKTIGSLVDKYLTVEGFFTLVLRCDKEKTEDNKIFYHFLTSDTESTVKSPMGMFEDEKIDNDLALVRQKILEFEN